MAHNDNFFADPLSLPGEEQGASHIQSQGRLTKLPPRSYFGALKAAHTEMPSNSNRLELNGAGPNLSDVSISSVAHLTVIKELRQLRLAPSAEPSRKQLPGLDA